MSLLSKKLYYKKLYDNDFEFVDKFGTPDQKSIWKVGGENIMKATDEKKITKTAELMGKIRDEIHSSHINDHNYRLLYLQKGPETYEQIKATAGKEIADIVKNLRKAKRKQMG